MKQTGLLQRVVAVLLASVLLAGAAFAMETGGERESPPESSVEVDMDQGSGEEQPEPPEPEAGAQGDGPGDMGDVEPPVPLDDSNAEGDAEAAAPPEEKVPEGPQDEEDPPEPDDSTEPQDSAEPEDPPEPEPENGGAAPAAAAEQGVLPPCETVEQLADLIRQNEGGVVTLTGDIHIDTYMEIAVARPTTVEMGDYGITIEAFSGLQLEGPIHLVGSGAEKPLIRVETYQVLILIGCTITAEGEGGIALSVGYYANFLNLWYPTIRATGESGVAIHGDVNLQLYYVNVEAEGSATGVMAEEEIFLIASRVTSDSDTLVSGIDELYLYGSIVEPLPPGRESLPLKARWWNSSNKAVLAIGEDLELLYAFDYLSCPGYSFKRELHTEPVWDTTDVDLSAPGLYTVRGTMDWPMQGLDIENLYQIECYVEVYDPDTLHLGYCFYNEFEQLALNMFPAFKYAGTVSLWSSREDGEWEKLPIADRDDGTSGLSGYETDVYFERLGNIVADRTDLENDVTYTFYVELQTDEGEVMRSNEMLVLMGEFDTEEIVGGDRAGTDRDPDPDGEPGNGSDGGGDNNGNGPGGSDGGGDNNGDGPGGSEGGGENNGTGPGGSDGSGSGGDPGGSIPGGDGDGDPDGDGGQDGGTPGDSGGDPGSEAGANGSTGGATRSGGSSGSARADAWRSPAAAPAFIRESEAVDEPETEPAPSPQASPPPVAYLPADEGAVAEQLLPRGQRFTAEELDSLISANPVQVTFIWSGMRLVVPTGALAALAGEELVVALEMPEDGVFLVALSSGGRALATLGEAFTVSIPYRLDDGLTPEDLYCLAEDGGAYPMASDGEGRVSVSLLHTGAYRVEVRETGEDGGFAAPQLPDSTLSVGAGSASAGRGVAAPAAAAVLVVGAAGAALWMRRRRNSKR